MGREGMAAPRGPTRQAEWGGVRQGKKVADGRCGRTIEAQPVSGQTCLIEPQRGWPVARGGRNELARASVFGTDGIAGAKGLTLTAVRVRRCLYGLPR